MLEIFVGELFLIFVVYGMLYYVLLLCNYLECVFLTGVLCRESTVHTPPI